MSYESNGRQVSTWRRPRHPVQPRPWPAPAPVSTIDRRPSDPWRYWAVLRRQGPFALKIFIFVVVVTIVGTLLQTPMFRASGLMEIRRASSEAVSMEALFEGESPSADYLETQHGLIRSYALATRVVRDLDLAEVEELANPERFPPRPGGTDDYTASELQPVVAAFHERLTLSPDAGGRLVRVQFDSEDPVLAADVVNSILDNFVEMRVDGTKEATSWLSDQLAEARNRLESAEGELQNYARANGLPLARGDEDVAANIQERLDALETELIAARTERLAAQARNQTMVEGGASEAVDNAVLEDLAIRIAELQREHAQLSATFTEQYPEVQRLERQIAALEARRDEERQRMARGITGEYQSAFEREQLLEQAVAQEQAASDSLMTKAAGYRILRREVEANRERYAALQEKLMDAEVATAVSAVDVDVVDRAMPPVNPYRPSLPLSAAFAFLGGALLALGGAFAREYLFPTEATAPDVEEAVDAPVLAVIPSTGLPQAGGAGQRLDRGPDRGFRRRGPSDAGGRWLPSTGGTAASRSGAISDAMGSLRAAVLFDQGPSAARSILVTSAVPGEGKTTVAVNFAISLAGMGRDVLLVDADMRRPCVGRVLEMGRGPGLVQFLDRSEDEWPALVQRDHVPGLDVLLAGGRPAAPGSLLASTRFGTLLAGAHELYDFVVIDGPALLIDAPDARIMADQVDGVVAVVRSGSTAGRVRPPVLSDVPNLLGVILNDLDPSDVPGEDRGMDDDDPAEAAGHGARDWRGR